MGILRILAATLRLVAFFSRRVLCGAAPGPFHMSPVVLAGPTVETPDHEGGGRAFRLASTRAVPRRLSARNLILGVVCGRRGAVRRQTVCVRRRLRRAVG